jgi:hypothetical protein
MLEYRHVWEPGGCYFFTGVTFDCKSILTNALSRVIRRKAMKHGLVQRVADWPWSSFHRYARMGTYPIDWGERWITI